MPTELDNCAVCHREVMATELKYGMCKDGGECFRVFTVNETGEEPSAEAIKAASAMSEFLESLI
jgi:hypothetical protein